MMVTLTLGNLVAITGVVLAVTPLLIKLGMERQKSKGRGERLDDQEGELEEVKESLNCIEDKQDEIKEKVEESINKAETSHERVTEAQKVIHDKVIEGNSCGHPVCTWCD